MRDLSRMAEVRSAAGGSDGFAACGSSLATRGRKTEDRGQRLADSVQRIGNQEAGNQSIRMLDIRGTGISEIVHAPNLKNKIGAGSALILSLRNSGENPNRFNVKRARKKNGQSW